MSADKHYAECVTDGCGRTFANNDEVDAHVSETMEAARAIAPSPHASISSHTYRVVNPSPEGRRKNSIRNTVDWAIESAIQDAIESLDRDVDRGDITADEVREGLLHSPDFRDAWDEYKAANS